MPGSPPPPHACSPPPPAEVRAADESAAPWFRGRTGEEVGKAAHIVHDLAAGAAEMERARDDSSRLPRDLADRLRDEEHMPVLEEPKHRQRSRGERER